MHSETSVQTTHLAAEPSRYEFVEGVQIIPTQRGQYVVELPRRTTAAPDASNDPAVEVHAGEDYLELSLRQAEELTARLARWTQSMRAALVRPDHRTVIFSHGSHGRG